MATFSPSSPEENNKNSTKKDRRNKQTRRVFKWHPMRNGAVACFAAYGAQLSINRLLASTSRLFGQGKVDSPLPICHTCWVCRVQGRERNWKKEVPGCSYLFLFLFFNGFSRPKRFLSTGYMSILHVIYNTSHWFQLFQRSVVVVCDILTFKK